ncbi:MAG: TraR/DksA family transcriptional regulator [Saprospiraceae bacterium]|nr:TraR/DksA family transcriptional regulator [Saprospiraceae bacterium]
MIDKEALKKKITELINKSEEEIVDLEDMSAPVSPENSIGRVSRMDAINNKSVVEAALRNKKEKLSKLKVALSKIDTPGFGLCAMCKHPIREGRLIFMPESSRCVRCADR